MEHSVEILRMRQKHTFFRRGILFALGSGICYGLYTAFFTLAETQSPWSSWFSNNSPFSVFTITFALAALAAAINDIFSGIWSLIVCLKNGQIADLRKTIMTKPGWVMMLCAIVGGPFATVCYVVALNSSTAAGNPGMIVPIAALNVASGAILARILLKQKMEPHTILGVTICILAAALIGGASFAAVGTDAIVGCLFAFLAAFGWGFEGCIAGFGTALIDYRIGITIRQLTAGILELLVMFPLLFLLGSNGSLIMQSFSDAVSHPSLFIFVISGFFAMPAYSFWYKGNSMCGTALGMACNGMYAFWGPFFIWIILGVMNIGGLSASYPPLGAAQWIGAVVMVSGIFCIAVSPLQIFKKQRENTDELSVGKGSVAIQEQPRKLLVPLSTNLPLNYAIMLQLAKSDCNECADEIVRMFEPCYGNNKQLNIKSVSEALATAKENGLVDEVCVSTSSSGSLCVWYRINDFGRHLVYKYIE